MRLLLVMLSIVFLAILIPCSVIAMVWLSPGVFKIFPIGLGAILLYNAVSKAPQPPTD